MVPPIKESCSVTELSYMAKDRLRTAYIKRANDMIKRSVKRTKQNLNLKALICTTMTQLEQMILFFFSIK